MKRLLTKEFLRGLSPKWVLHNLHRFLLDPARKLIWGSMDLQCVLRSGLTVRVKSAADWEIYNEVMVNGEYDEAITHAFKRSSGREIRVLDLGANVGYFAVRCADFFLQANVMGKSLSIVAVEGAPHTFNDLRGRVDSDSLLRDKVRVVHGLAGERSGSAFISDGATHYGNSIASGAGPGNASVPYIDVAAAVGLDNEIDLLKCDIEGSEFTFIRNYPDFLARVKTAVFEFHNYGEDIEKYRQLLCSYGFRRQAILREAPLFSIEVFDRV